LFIIIASIIISNICLNMITIKIYTNIRFPFAFIINKNLVFLSIILLFIPNLFSMINKKEVSNNSIL
ncbi:MAG: hypothetical protein ACTSWX_14795, partial [Promethearchaeota archaeon]